MRFCSVGKALALLTPFLASAEKDTHLEEAQAIFDWVAGTQDGFVSPKVELRRDIPGDPNSPMGVFAKETVEIGEVIVKVPWSVILKPDEPEEYPSQLVCGTVRTVAREMRLGAESKYAPYVMYLNNEADAQIPSTWTEPAKEFLHEILDYGEIPPVDPTSWIEREWFGRCGGDPNDNAGIKAALMAIQRADDALMIPAYDNLNHRNGNWTNTITEIEVEEYHITTATKTINPGEQIYISYNMCEECGGRRSGYGTAGTFQNQGMQ